VLQPARAHSFCTSYSPALSSLDRLRTDKSYKPEIKVLQIQLTGFLDKDTPKFCKELWNLCLSAQTSPQGVPKELLEAKKLELIQEKVRSTDDSVHGQSADSYRLMQNGLQKKHAFAKSKREQRSEMWTQFDNESETNAVAAEVEAAAEEAVARFMTGAQVIQGHLHDEETRRAVLHRHDEMWTPTFHLEEAIEELVLEAGLVPDQFRGQYRGPLLDRDLHSHIARKLSAPSGQGLLLVQGYQRSSGRDCQAVPFPQSGVAL
jgi:PWI domain